MKTMETTFPGPKALRRVPKPLMEKRRRERINYSLETLRRLLLENTRNEKLRNPKVEKAEILENVVEFLRTEHEEEQENPSMKRALPSEGDGGSPCERRKNYREGMKSCLLRVSHFITTKSQELEETTDAGTSPQKSTGLTHPPIQPQLPFQQAVAPSPSQDPAPSPLSEGFYHNHKGPGLCKLTQRTSLSHDPRSRQSPSPTSIMELGDSVWRPWPQ